MRRDMSELFKEKVKEVETSFLLLEKAQKELDEEANWVDIDDETSYFYKATRGVNVKRKVSESDVHGYIEAIGHIHMNEKQHQAIEGGNLRRKNRIFQNDRRERFIRTFDDFVSEKLQGQISKSNRLERKSFISKLVANICADRCSSRLNPRAKAIILQRMPSIKNPRSRKGQPRKLIFKLSKKNLMKVSKRLSTAN